MNCTRCEPCKASFCDCGPCNDMLCETCEPTRDNTLVCACMDDPTPCTICLLAAQDRARNGERALDDAYPAKDPHNSNWEDEDSEGSGGDSDF